MFCNRRARRELAAVEAGQGAIEEHRRNVRLSGKHTGESGNGVIVGLALNGNEARLKKPGRVVGASFSWRSMMTSAIGEQAVVQTGLHSGVEQIGVVGMECDFGFEQLCSPRQIIFLQIGGGSDDVQLGRIGFGEREFSRVFEAGRAAPRARRSGSCDIT